MKKLNLPLLIGVIIVVLLILVSVFPEGFSDIDPYGRQRYEYDSSSSKMVNPISPPSKEYPWGSDQNGRDIRSLIIYGCRATMLVALLVALGRLLIALPIAILAAYGNKLCRWLIKQFNIIFSALPIILMIFILSRFRFLFDTFATQRNVMIFLFILIGWSKLAKVLAAKINDIIQQDFIEGEIAIGKNGLEIAVQNILPHVIPTIVVMFFMEMAVALLVMTQLGVFGVVTSGAEDAFVDTSSFPYDFDWSTLLAGANRIITSRQNMWIILYPTACFALSIIGLNLFGEGLRMEFEKRDSKVISFIRRIPSILSPVKYIYQVRNYQAFKSSVLKKSTAILLIVLIIFFPQKSSAYKFYSEPAFNIISELSSEKYQGRPTGTESGKQAAEYIAEQLKNYEITPYNGSFIHEYEFEAYGADEASELLITSTGEAPFKALYINDYMILSTEPIDEELKVFVLSSEEIEQLASQNSSLCENQLVLVDIREFGENWIKRLSGLIKDKLKAKGIVFIEKWYSGKFARKVTIIDKVFSDGIIMSLSSNVGDMVLKLDEPSFKLSYNPESILQKKGYNIVGYIEGNDKVLKNEIIIVGSSFDYIGDFKTIRYPGAMAIGGAAIELEIARVLSESDYKPDRTLVFAFWDGSNLKYNGSTSFIIRNFNDPTKKYFNLDLNDFISKGSTELIVDTTNISPKDKAAQGIIKAIKENARRNKIKLSFGKVKSQVTENMNYENRSIILFDSNDRNRTKMTSKDNIENINEKLLGRAGQLLLDVVVHMSGDTKE